MVDLADLFDWLALDSKHEAEQTDDPKQREMWFRLSELWAAAARQEAWQGCGGGATKAGPLASRWGT